MATTQRNAAEEITRLAAERILVLDGAWGVLLQNRGLNEADFRGERFAGHRRDLLNDPDLLNLTRPDIVREVHDALLRGRRRHHDDEHVHGDVDRPGRLRARGRRLRDERRRRAHRARGRRPTASSPARSARSTSRSRSARASTTPASARTRSTQVDETYAEQIRGLAEGGVDLLLIETIFDTLNAKAAIAAAREVAPELPLWISRDDRRPLRPHALGPDDRGVLDLDRARRPADRRRQLLARRA